MTDWREQAYEDAYWEERDIELMERAIGQIKAVRDEERAEVKAGLLGA